MKPTLLVVGAVLVALAVALLVGVAVHTSGSKGDVKVDEIEYHIAMPTTLRAGRHTFAVTNNGTEPHELLIFRTGLAAKALPRAGAIVDAASPLLHLVVSSGHTLKPGETRSITATLTPGHYVVICNLAAHYGLGMRVDLTVTK